MLAHPTCCNVCIECSCHNKQYKMHKVHCRPCTFFCRVKCERLMFKMISRARKIGQSLGGLIRILHHHYLSVWWLEVYDDYKCMMTFKNKTDAYFNQITFHWLCPTQNIKWLMVDSWQCHWVEAKLQRLELQRDPCHFSVHCSMIREWHMHCALSLWTMHCNVHCAPVHWSMIRGWHMHCRVWKVAPRLRPP